MTPRSAYEPTETKPPLNPPVKNVDEAPKRLGFSGISVADIGHLGGGFVREKFLQDLTAGDFGQWTGDIGDTLPILSSTDWDAKFRKDWLGGIDIDTRRTREDYAALNKEYEADRAAGRSTAGFIPPKIQDIPHRERDHRAVAKFLPPELVVFLDKFDSIQRRKREIAILEKIGWDGLELLALPAHYLTVRGEKAAARYAMKFPSRDENDKPINQSAEHRKRRLARTWCREMRTQARKARSYVSTVLRSFGGPKTPERQLYVPDYSVIRYRDEGRESRERMEKLRIVMVNKPIVQIEMLKAHERKKMREMAKRRLLTDVNVTRAEAIGARPVWATITLPGEYHCHPTNVGNEVTEHDLRLGPDEAMREMQHLYHQTMCQMRENDIRPWGFWDAQAQQDGTPHRHILAFIHDRYMSEDDALLLTDPHADEGQKGKILAASDDRTLAEARAVADGLWQRFSSTPVPKRQEETRREDPGCSAYVVGDTDPRYAPRKGRDGGPETAASITKYMVRYSTRMATGMGDMQETGADVTEDTPATDFERHAVWATERSARLHNWIGKDSQRSANMLWDCIWKAAERGEWPQDRRMNLAIDHMMSARGCIDELVKVRAELAFFEKQVDEIENVEKWTEKVRKLSAEAAHYAYHACLAAGLWPDKDLHISERLWLRGELDVKKGQPLPLPAIPLRKERENAFGETVKETIGIAAPIITARGTAKERRAAAEAREADEMMITEEDGSWMLVRPSDNPLKQIILKTDKWVIVDKSTADKMVDDAKKKFEESIQKFDDEQRAAVTEQERLELLAYQLAVEKIESGVSIKTDSKLDVDSEGIIEVEEKVGISDAVAPLSLIPTDPRKGATPLLEGDEEASGAPSG